MNQDLKTRLAGDAGIVAMLSDLFRAEESLLEALAKLSVAVSSPNLAAAFNRHQQATREHAQRIERILRNGMDLNPRLDGPNSLSPLIAEGESIIARPMGQHAKDAALLELARTVEQREMSLYASAIEAARSLGLPDQWLELLSRTWSEEEEADKTLELMAEEFVYPALAAERRETAR